MPVVVFRLRAEGWWHTPVVVEGWRHRRECTQRRTVHLAIWMLTCFAVAITGSVAASAQGDGAAVGSEANPMVALPGDCPMSAPIEPGIGVDCFFDVSPDVDPAALQFTELVEGDDVWPCRVEAVIREQYQLVCRDVVADRYEDGTFAFDLWIGGELIGEAVTLTKEWDVSPVAAVFTPSGGEPVTFDGRPLEVVALSYGPVDDVFIVIRERNSDLVAATAPIEIGESFQGQDQAVELELPPGRYRYWPCLGPSPTACEERPGGQAFQLIEGEILDLVPGHNRISADRINVLFVSSGLERIALGDTSKMLPELAVQMLTLDGPFGDDHDGVIRPETEKVSRLVWGPMSIEPLASNVDRFNFWYLPEEIADEEQILSSGFVRSGDLGFDLPNLQITALYNSGSAAASDARAASFETTEPERVPPRGRLYFGDARVWVSEFDPVGSATTLAHEWGHGLFGLRDEYYGFDGREIVVGYPNCAPDEATALDWWGTLVGATDPFADHVRTVSAERLEADALEILGDVVERMTIEISPGGCYSDVDSADVFRPSADSLMNSEVPVFGAVNRRRVQAVLDQFSGRGPMAGLDDLTLACEGLAGSIDCTGELRTHLDRPLSIVAIDSSPCEFGTARRSPTGEVLPVRVTCSTVGSPTEPVRLSFKSESRLVDVTSSKPLPSTSPMERTLSVDESPIEGSDDVGTRPWRTVLIGVLLCLAALALAFVERRRRANDEQTQ